MKLVVEISALIKAAAEARRLAYAPYSGFCVGAALFTKSGAIFVGANVECVSFGLTMCAEQGAISAAIASGERDFLAIAVVTDSDHLVMPCGRCRQLLAEFKDDMEVISATLDGRKRSFPLSALLPQAKQGLLQSLKEGGDAR